MGNLLRAVMTILPLSASTLSITKPGGNDVALNRETMVMPLP